MSRFRYFFSSAILVVLAAATLVIAASLHSADERRLNHEQQALAAQVTSAFGTVTGTTAFRLSDLSAAIEKPRGYDRRGFVRLAPLLLQQPELDSIGFNLIVPAAGRAAYERNRGVRITKPVDRGKPVPASRAKDYIVRDALATRTKGDDGIGTNLGGEPQRRAAMEQAIDAGQPVAATKISLIDGSGAGTVIYMPVHRRGAALGSVAERRKATVGVVSGIYRTPVLTATIDKVVPQHEAFRISRGGVVLGAGGGRLESPLTRQINHLGRTWSLQVGRGSHTALGNGPLVVMMGLLAVMLIAALLWVFARRERYALRVADKRTDELKQSAQRLKEQVVFETALMSSIDDGVMACDSDGKFVIVNDAAYKISGMLPGAVPFERTPAARQLLQADGKTPMAFEDTPMMRAIRGEECENVEMVVMRDDGDDRVVLGTARRIFDGDELAGAVVTLHDVTEQVAADRELVKAARFFEVTQDLMGICRFGGEIVATNARWTETLGWNESEMLSKDFLQFIHPDDREQGAIEAARMSKGGVLTNFRQRFLAKDGSYHWLEWSGVGVPEDGVFYGTARDISARVELQQELEQERAMLARAQEMAQLGHFEWDVDTNSSWWSDEQWKLYGLEPRDGVPEFEDWMSAVHPEDRQMFTDLFGDHGQDPHSFKLEYRVFTPDQRWVTLAVRGEIVRDADGRPIHFSGTSQDISERKLLEGKLRHLADHDELTGLHNRRSFEQSVERQVAMARRYEPEGALLMIDVDNLKKVNDSQGHAAGDSLLITAADAMRDRLRGHDVIGRVGGDEFAVLLPKADHAGAIATAQSLLERIGEESIRISDQGVTQVTASIGVAMLEDVVPLSEANAFAAADKAMYEAKNSGRNQCVVYVPPVKSESDAA